MLSNFGAGEDSWESLEIKPVSPKGNQPWSSFSILSFCLFILFMGFSRQEYWSDLPFPLLWITFCQTSPPWPAHLGWPHRSWLSFIELDKAVVLVWLDWLVFGDSEKAMATHSSTLAWKILWTEEPGVLSSMGLQIVRPHLATEKQLVTEKEQHNLWTPGK